MNLASRIQGTSVGNGMISFMRLILALSALGITVLDPTQPDRYVLVTYTALVLYTVYSAILYVLSSRQSSLLSSFENWDHWADIVWFLIFIALSSGTSSIFFFFFFFSILAASFRKGFHEGMNVTIVSAGLFTIIGYLTAPSGPEFELNRLLLRPVYLLLLGYMIAFWGGHEIMLKRRLALLNDINTLSNPRFGVDRTIGLVMEQLRAFYGADICLLITSAPSPNGFQMRRADGHDPEAATRAQPLTAEIAQVAFVLPNHQALRYCHNLQGWRDKVFSTYDIITGEHQHGDFEAIEALATILDATCLISVPVRCRSTIIGRLCLAANRPIFDDTDIQFIIQVMEHVTPIIENIRLVDTLASDAAETERQRIARDIHDSVIQPYIGLQMGLAGVREKAACGSTTVVEDLDYLIGLTDSSVTDLRQYVHHLKSTAGHDSSLIPALCRFAGKFMGATGIRVDIEAMPNTHVPDRLAAEVFQIVSEGLSNVRRHTQAGYATVALARQGDHLVVRIENESRPNAPEPPRSNTSPRSNESPRSNGSASRASKVARGFASSANATFAIANSVNSTPFSGNTSDNLPKGCDFGQTNALFTPVSISERAEALGGEVVVQQCTESTVVVVKIPL